MGIQRIQRGRQHGYTINGQKAIGVTTALSDGFPKPALISWAARCVAEEVADMSDHDLGFLRGMGRDHAVGVLRKAPDRKRDTAAVRGTKVHGYAEKIIDGADVDVPVDLLPHVEQVVKFLDEWQVVPLLSENVVGSYRHGYAGTFDLVGELPGGERVLFDYKTGKSGIWPETAMQLSAYQHADCYVATDGTEIPLREVGIDCCKAVWVRADGYDVVPLQTDDAVFLTFLQTLAIARIKPSMHEWIGAPQHHSDYLKKDTA